MLPSLRVCQDNLVSYLATRRALKTVVWVSYNHLPALVETKTNRPSLKLEEEDKPTAWLL